MTSPRQGPYRPDPRPTAETTPASRCMSSAPVRSGSDTKTVPIPIATSPGVALGMPVGCRRVVAGRERGRRCSSAQTFDPAGDVAPVHPDHRTVEHGHLDLGRVATGFLKVSAETAILRATTVSSEVGRLTASAWRAAMASVRRSPDPPTMIGIDP